MKKTQPKRAGRTRHRRASPLTLFAGGLTAVFLVYALGKKNDAPDLAGPERPAIAGGPDPACAASFTRAVAPVTPRTIEAMIEALESPGMSRIEIVHKVAAHYARAHGYNRPQTLEEGSRTNLTKHLARDLRMLLHYRGSITREFSSAIADALHDFQYRFGLAQTSQPDAATLTALSQEMAANELKIALYATRTAMKYNISPRELLLLISAESGNDPMAQAGTSSALGLGQFLEDTWLELMGRHGEKLGFGHFAKGAKALIAARDSKRGLSRAEKALRESILDMRKNMALSIEMIALYGLEVTGGKFTAKGAYAGYFLGPGDYARYIANPDASAGGISPQAAKANERIYKKTRVKRPVMARDKKGRLKPVKGKYEWVWTGDRTTSEVINIVTAKVGDDQREADVDRMLANVQGLYKTHLLAFNIQGGPQNVKCAPSIVPDETPQTAGRIAAIQVN